MTEILTAVANVVAALSGLGALGAAVTFAVRIRRHDDTHHNQATRGTQ